MTWVLDASAAVEFLLRSRLGLAVERALGSARVLAPELLDAEVLAVVRRLALAGQLPVDRAEEVLEDLGAWDLERVPNRGLLAAAWELRHNVSAYDALYVAAAALHGAELLTADGPLARVTSLRVVVHNVRRALG